MTLWKSIPLLSSAARSGKQTRLTRFVRRLKPWQRLVGGAILIPGLLAGGTSGAYYYKLHRLSSQMTLAGLPVTAAPQPTRRVLVLSPHCDDETLGAGSYIAAARRNKTPVTVAFLTNGDGFRVAASRTLGEVNVGPSDFVRFAEVRQKEALAALSKLGVDSQNVEFLGYPDRGLRPLWEQNWDNDHLFRSGFTGHTHSPYARAFHKCAPYSGESLQADLVRLMEKVQPTDILVTHPADDHPDHNAAPSFAQAALRICQARGDAWAKTTSMRYYIVHRGDWPLPQGKHLDQPLLPPPGLVTRDARWNVFSATPQDRAAQANALNEYRSQTQVSGRFLWSFVRTNGLFADLPLPEAAPDTAPADVLAACETTAGGPYGDSLARYVEPGADLTSLGVAVEGKYLRVRLTTRGRVSPRLRYSLLLRGSQTLPDGKTATRFTAERLIVGPKERGGQVLEARIALSRVALNQPGHDRRVWVSAESRWANRLPLIDRTGYRPFLLPDAPKEPDPLLAVLCAAGKNR